MSWASVKPMANDPIEAGYYPLALESYEIKTTKPESGSKLMYAARFRIEESGMPELDTAIGRAITDWFVVGADDDPGAEDQSTLNDEENRGIRKMKRLAEAANFVPDDPEGEITTDLLLEILDGCTGKRIEAFITKKNENNNIQAYFKLGERPLGLASKPKTGSLTQKATAQASKTNNIFQAQAAAKAAKATISVTTVKPKIAKPTIVEEDLDEVEAALPAKKVVKAVKTKAPAAIKCPLGCGEEIAYKDLAAHAEVCTGDSENE